MPFSSVVDTESYARKLTNIACEMKSMHVYSTFAAMFTAKDPVVCLELTSTARDAVHAMKLVVIK